MRKIRGNKTCQAVVHLATTLSSIAIGLGAATSAHATIASPDEVIVTARRTEEVIQNVPISMTVFNQEMLNERNVTNAADLVNYTPSLNVNTRFGSDQATFAIRGFTQDLGTTASVAVYFADVAAPRAGGGQINAGDGAGPGAFFDLQNVQVLKGPQGTLFGRNTTGGAIQLVPQEPTGKQEGYLELSAGNYAMKRAQGVFNLPISDSVRARFGLDTMRRDGYLRNMSSTGPDRLADVNYWSARASLIWDATDAIQNYTILSYTHSDNNGSIQKLIACDPHSAGYSVCKQTLDAQGHGFYNVSAGDEANPASKLKQMQIINTTSWEISDNLSFKNLLSFATLTQDMTGANFGADYHLPAALGGTHIVFYPSDPLPGYHNNNQSTWVEEVRLSGTALDDKLTWQGGYYFEDSRPNDWTGALNAAGGACDPFGSADPTTWNCFAPSPAGSVGYQKYHQEFNNQALYAQGTYDITDEWRATLGLRYTVDNTHADYDRVTYNQLPGLVSTPAGLQPSYGVPGAAFCSSSGAPTDPTKTGGCLMHSSQKSEAPTWLIDIDYLPTPDVMAYVKYARGYRQGSILPAAPPGLSTYDPERVNAYELGTKTSFHALISGTFNVALFYNELTNQQLQAGFVPGPGQAGAATTAIVNAGSSTIQGVEMETTLKLLDDLTFTLGYTYLETHLNSWSDPVSPGWVPSPSVAKGGHLSLSPRHTVVTGLSYRLPLPAEIGEVSAGATYTFTSEQFSAVGTPYQWMPDRQLLNLNLGWKAIYGSPFDATFFMTNALNENYYAFIPGLWHGAGAEFATTAEPKMWGARVKYNF